MGCALCRYEEPKEMVDQHFDQLFETLPSMEGKTVAITGSTTGTGLVCAQTCARLGATVVLLNRASDRVKQARVSVKNSAAQTGPQPTKASTRQSVTAGQMRAGEDDNGTDDAIEGKIVIVECDLRSFKGVKAAAEQLNGQFKESGLDVLVNNAGVMALKDQATEDGCDIQMQVNHLSHFLLTQAVMPLLETAAAQRGEARVVNHSSIARTEAKKKGLEAKYLGKNGGNLGGDSSSPMGEGRWMRYSMTKWANVVFTHALHDRLAAKGSKIKCVVAHPGVAATNLQVTTVQDSGMPGFAANLLVSQSAADGALGIIRGACATDVNSCDFYGPPKEGFKGPAELLPADTVPDADKKMLWEESEKSCGISFVV